MELKKIMKDAGIVGAGGAGFPSYAKLAEGADTLLINGAECEPLLYTDYTILQYEMNTVLAGIREIMKASGISRSLIAIKEHTAERLMLDDKTELAPGIFLKVLPNVYPIGDEIGLIYESTGKVVSPGCLPISVGVIVFNVETVYNIAKAAENGAPVTKKWLTIGGDVPKSYVVRVPVGTKVSELFERLGIKVPEGHSVIDGGPSMGKIINYRSAAVTKTTKGLLVLPSDIQAINAKKINYTLATSRAETACCQCTRCTDMCPRNLLGYPLEPHKMVRTAMGAAEAMPKMVLNATLCCGCGVCETLACCQGISPRAVIANYKKLLAENKLRYTSTEKCDVTNEREYRKIPSERWMRALGVLEFDKTAEYLGEINDFSTVEIPTSKHIGAPSIIAVRDGDRVNAEQPIALATDGLCIPQHASKSGIVSLDALSGTIIIK